MLVSHQWMKPEAVAAWLIPSEFLQTAYGASLRYYLTHKVRLVRIHQFSHTEPQFENAEVLPVVVVFRNREPSVDDTVILSSGGTLERPATNEVVSIKDLRNEGQWFI